MNDIIWYLALQSIILLFFIFRTYTSSYVAEKGKGLATKEDIGVITTKIEEVRIEYNSKLEATKASIQLDLFTNQQFFQKSTDILLRYYDTIVELSYDNLSKDLGSMGGPNYAEKLFEYQQETTKKFTSLIVDYHRLLIFMDDNENVIKNCKEILKLSLSLSEIFNKHFGKVKMTLINEAESLAISKEAYFEACAKTDEANKVYRGEISIIKGEFNNAIGDFISTLMIYFKQKNLL